jgi:hypothetical protein
MTVTRRFLLKSASTAGAMLAFGAHAQVNVDEKDPQAVALGYVADAGRADGKKFPKYAAGQSCSNCALYQGKAGDASGKCPLFAGKEVSAKGWCSAWSKKA